MVTELVNDKMESLKTVNVAWRRARSPCRRSGTPTWGDERGPRTTSRLPTPGYSVPSTEAQPHTHSHDNFDSQRHEIELQGKRRLPGRDWEGGDGRRRVVLQTGKHSGWSEGWRGGTVLTPVTR